MYKNILVLFFAILVITGCAVKDPFTRGIKSGKVVSISRHAILGTKEGLNKVYYLSDGGRVALSSEEEKIIDVVVGDYVVVNFSKPQSLKVTKPNGTITLYQYDQFENIKVVNIKSLDEKKEEPIKQEKEKPTADNWR